MALHLGAGSSVGRASALQAEGHRFKPCSAYHSKCAKVKFGGVVQFGQNAGLSRRRSRVRVSSLPPFSKPVFSTGFFALWPTTFTFSKVSLLTNSTSDPLKILKPDSYGITKVVQNTQNPFAHGKSSIPSNSKRDLKPLNANVLLRIEKVQHISKVWLERPVAPAIFKACPFDRLFCFMNYYVYFLQSLFTDKFYLGSIQDIEANLVTMGVSLRLIHRKHRVNHKTDLTLYLSPTFSNPPQSNYFERRNSVACKEKPKHRNHQSPHHIPRYFAA